MDTKSPEFPVNIERRREMNEEVTIDAEEVEVVSEGHLTSDEKLWGMLSHLLTFSGLVGVPFGNFLAPLIIMLVQQDKSEYVVYHAKESLNMQISYFVYTLLAAALCLVIIGFLILPVIAIAGIVYVIIAGIKANEGVRYEYPFIFRLIK